MESVMRRATKLFRLRNEIYDLGGMSAADLERNVTECFDLAAESER
jgi:hypothetical protein